MIGKLTAMEVARVKKPGMYSDGGGLYLQVTPSGAKSWIFRFRSPTEVRPDGRFKDREMGLGAAHTFTLAEARAKATECRKLRADGVDPIESRERQRTERRVAAATSMTFANCAAAYIDAHEITWRNAKHRQQWRNTLDSYALPVFGKLPVASIDTSLVMKAVEPIWTKKPETASRLRGRIESVLDWAAARHYRAGENPARWRGHLENLLPNRAKVRKVEHHAALSYAELPAFMAALRIQKGTAARALEFLILTAARTGEVIGARWQEIDFAEKVWTVPAARMKAGREHRVPLSPRAVALLREMQPDWAKATDFAFPGGKVGRPLSKMALLALLERMGRDDLTSHGFRSTFRDWAAERTSFPREVAEQALAHTLSDKVEAAYRRGDALDKRRRLMEAWAKYADTPVAAGNVVSLDRAATSGARTTA